MSERLIRVVHGIIFVLVCIVSIVALGLAVDLVIYYEKNGHPRFHGNAYRDRIRISLTAASWSTLFGIFLTIGLQLRGHSLAFGILPHLVIVLIGFLLFVIGTASLTQLVNKVSCDDPYQTFNRCKEVKVLMVVGWVDVVLLFVAFLFVLAIMFRARSRGSVVNTLYVE